MKFDVTIFVGLNANANDVLLIFLTKNEVSVESPDIVPLLTLKKTFWPVLKLWLPIVVIVSDGVDDEINSFFLEGAFISYDGNPEAVTYKFFRSRSI